MGGDYASARDIRAMFYCLHAPEHPFGSRKGNAIEKGLTEGGRRSTLSRKMEGEGGWDGKG